MTIKKSGKSKKTSQLAPKTRWVLL